MKRLLCRLLGHRWEPYYSFATEQQECGVICIRCGHYQAMLRTGSKP